MKRRIKWAYIGLGSILIYVLLYLMSMFDQPIGFDVYGVLWLGASLLIIWEVVFRVFRLYHKNDVPVKVKSALLFFITALPFGILSFDILYLILRVLEYVFGGIWELEWVHWVISSAIGAILSMFTVSIILLSETLSRWGNVELNMEKLKRQNSDIQLSSLKEQISPHFLFNNLNTLQTLVKENSEYTLSYIHHMASLYRYILDHQHDELVTVNQELEFVNSYASLLKERFGEDVNITIDIDNSFLDKHVPLLSVYTLIENAIKHNKASAEQPLQIVLNDSENGVVVKNNRVSKEDVISSKIGLKNLEERYALLSGQQSQPKVQQTSEAFTVTLPLIEVTAYERSNS